MPLEPGVKHLVDTSWTAYRLSNKSIYLNNERGDSHYELRRSLKSFITQSLHSASRTGVFFPSDGDYNIELDGITWDEGRLTESCQLDYIFASISLRNDGGSSRIMFLKASSSSSSNAWPLVLIRAHTTQMMDMLIQWIKYQGLVIKVLPIPSGILISTIQQYMNTERVAVRTPIRLVYTIPENAYLNRIQIEIRPKDVDAIMSLGQSNLYKGLVSYISKTSGLHLEQLQLSAIYGGGYLMTQRGKVKIVTTREQFNFTQYSAHLITTLVSLASRSHVY